MPRSTTCMWSKGMDLVGWDMLGLRQCDWIGSLWKYTVLWEPTHLTEGSIAGVFCSELVTMKDFKLTTCDREPDHSSTNHDQLLYALKGLCWRNWIVWRGVVEWLSHTDWAALTVCAKSVRAVRICGDYEVTVDSALAIIYQPDAWFDCSTVAFICWWNWMTSCLHLADPTNHQRWGTLPPFPPEHSFVH